MRTTTATAALTALGLGALLAITGCTTTPDPAPTHTASAATPTHTTAPSPTPSTAVPAQKPVDPPKNAQDAMDAANKTIKGYLALEFQLDQDPSQGADFMAGYVAGYVMSVEKEQSKDLAAKGSWVSGSPATWQQSPVGSYTGTETWGSKKLPHAVAYMVGCEDASGLKWHNSTAKGTTNALQYTVMYQPTERVWKVTHAAVTTGKKGAPKC